MVEELLEAGAEVVEPEVDEAKTVATPLTSYVEASTPEAVAGMETSKIWVAS